MKDKEKGPVGSLLAQKVVEDKDTDSEILYAGCVGLVLALFWLYYFLFCL